ncbi:hypothetical protein ANO11243_042350 [Dothideomycetidae sp. 11243]|nr:hypothetical protein ANO11243_042350 [fungal sp. No.11243]
MAPPVQTVRNVRRPSHVALDAMGRRPQRYVNDVMHPAESALVSSVAFKRLVQITGRMGGVYTKGWRSRGRGWISSWCSRPLYTVLSPSTILRSSSLESVLHPTQDGYSAYMGILPASECSNREICTMLPELVPQNHYRTRKVLNFPRNISPSFPAAIGIFAATTQTDPSDPQPGSRFGLRTGQCLTLWSSYGFHIDELHDELALTVAKLRQHPRRICPRSFSTL